MTSDPITRLNAALEGRYRIERELGEGGMATVYLAEDLRHERKVALKVLKPELAAVVGAERFLAEIKTTANLQHPHVLPLHDSGEADGFLYFVTPFIEGESLRDRLDRDKQLPVDDAVRIASEIADALDYAHRQGVIHRDVKPGNILLHEGRVLVADFGIALAVGAAGGDRITETGLSLGTPHYMSPEQATGDQQVGPPTDIHALGCVLYEMLVGTPPYLGGTAQSVLGKILTGTADPVSEHRTSVPANVDAAIRRALEKVPADRFTAAQEFAAALSDSGFQHGEEATAGAMAGAGLWNPLSIGLAVVALVSTAGLGWLVLRPDRAVPVTRLAVDFFDDQGVEGQGTFDISADGSLLVYQGPGPTGGGTQLWARRWAALNATPIRDTEGVAGAVISPDGQEVAFTIDNSVRVVPISGGIPRTLASEGVSCCVGWSPDGAWLYFTNPAQGLSRVPVAGGPVEIVTEIEAPDGEIAHLFPDVLPSGEAVVFHVRGLPGPRVFAARVESGEVIELTPGSFPRYSQGYLLFTELGGETLFAQPFDSDNLELSGAATPIAEGLRTPLGRWSYYAVSPSGTLVYTLARGPRGSQLVLVDRDGSEEPLGFERRGYVFPRFSPDGGRLAAGVPHNDSDDLELWVLDLERLSQTRVTFGGDSRFPIWTLEGDRLTHSSRYGDTPILLTAADGSGQVDTLLAGESFPFATSWSPEGALVYHSRGQLVANRSLRVLPPEGEPEPIASSPASDRDGAFSPDGGWLAYRSNRSGRFEVYVRPHPGPGSEVTVSAGGGSGPVWSPDGSEIFYRTENQMMAVAVDMTDGFRADPPRALFNDFYDRSDATNAPNFDVSPDGQRFVMVRPDVAAELQVVLVQNFFEELRQVVPE